MKNVASGSVVDSLTVRDCRERERAEENGASHARSAVPICSEPFNLLVVIGWDLGYTACVCPFQQKRPLSQEVGCDQCDRFIACFLCSSVHTLGHDVLITHGCRWLGKGNRGKWAFLL